MTPVGPPRNALPTLVGGAFFNPDARLNDVPSVDTAAAREVHDQLLANRPEAASHNSDICPFCVDKATEDTTASRNPPADGGPDVSDTNQIPDEHGGRDTSSMSDTMTKETHEALLAAKVAEAVSATENALATKTDEASKAVTELETVKAELDTAKAEVTRLNGELDTAQVGLKAAQDEVTQLKADIAAKDEAASKAEIASKRAEQVKNLKLYDDEYVAERAEQWADLSDNDWASRLDEWAKIRPADTSAPNSDAASAMSGTSGDLTKEPSSTDTAGDQSAPTSARRAVLNLT